MYKVVKLFTDLQDNNFKYEVGDEYPRLGLKPSLARIKELSGSDNKQHTPLIKEVADEIGSDEVAAEAEVKAEAETKPKRSKKK